MLANYQYPESTDRSLLKSTRYIALQLLASFKNGNGGASRSPHDTIVLLQHYISRLRVYIHVFLQAGTKPPPHEAHGVRRNQEHAHPQYAWLVACRALPARWRWRPQAQWTLVRLRQPLMMRECLSGQVWSDGKESHTA